MQKVTLSSAALAAIIAMTIPQACEGTAGKTGTPSNAIMSVTVTIATATPGAYLRYTLDGSTPTGGVSGNGTEIAAAKGKVTLTFGPRGRMLKAIAYKPGLEDSPVAVGNYVYQSPY